MAEVKVMKGFFVKRSEKAPEFVVSNFSIKVDDFIQYLNENKNSDGYVNGDILKKKDGSGLYAKLSDWKPNSNNNDTPF